MTRQRGANGTRQGWARGTGLLVLAGMVAVGVPCRGAGEPATPGWLGAELAVFGRDASGTWQGAALGTSNVGGELRPGPEAGGGRTGRKVAAGLLSLVLPGAGQYYNGDRQKAFIFAGVEAAVWATYLTFDSQGDGRSDTYRDYAGVYADVPGGGHDEAYWRALGRYLDSDAYNESIRREARAAGEEPRGLIGPEMAWQWRNEDRFRVYQELRADASRAYSRRDFMTLFAILNRVVAVYDAVRNSVDDKLNGEVLGFHVAFSVNPSLRRPATGCVVSRRF